MPFLWLDWSNDILFLWKYVEIHKIDTWGTGICDKGTKHGKDTVIIDVFFFHKGILNFKDLLTFKLIVIV